jgi:hypothetical protein
MAIKKKAAKKSVTKKTANVNIKGAVVPDNNQTSTIQFSAKLTLTPGKQKRVNILVTGDPIKKMTLRD